MLVSLPLLLRVRLGRFAAPVPPEALEGPAALGAQLARVLPPLDLDVLLIERLETAEPGAGDGAEPVQGAVSFARLGVLELVGATPVPPALATLTLGPAQQLGSDRALLLELVARAPRSGDALRFLQMAAPHEAGEVLASRPVAAELEALGGSIVGGPSPPVFTAKGALLTRI